MSIGVVVRRGLSHATFSYLERYEIAWRGRVQSMQMWVDSSTWLVAVRGMFFLLLFAAMAR